MYNFGYKYFRNYFLQKIRTKVVLFFHQLHIKGLITGFICAFFIKSYPIKFFISFILVTRNYLVYFDNN